MNKEVINIFVGFAVLVITASAVGGLVLSLSITAGAEEVTGDVIINEIMYNPSTEQGPDSDLEWLELYNNDTIPINISGWTIETPSVGTITEDVIMQPEAYVMLARNKTYFEGYYGALPCSVIDVTMGLGNTEDTIVLKDSTGIEIDNVTYIDDWGADGNGRTLERNETGGWAESIVDGGTPCEENSALWDNEPPMVINATATPSTIAVNAGNTVLHVDVADRDSNINNVTIDLSPIGKSPDTIMTLVGNYMMEELTWLQFEHETNASIAGTFNLKVNATDTYGNYNDTERIELTVLSPSFTINITSPEDRKYASTCVRLNFTVEPEGTALDWIGYRLDGGANVTITGNTTVPVGAPPYDHNIVVYANDTDGNLTISNIVFFTIHPGDIDFGGKVWIGDVFLLRAAYGSHLGEDNWNANADLDCNSHVWIADVFILRQNYGNEY